MIINNDDDSDPLNNSLGIGPIVPSNFSKTISNLVTQAKNDSAKEDFTFARANIREVVETGNDAIHKLSQIADQTQDPKAFEVISKLMTVMVSANKELLEIQQKIRILEKSDEPHHNDAKADIVNNNLFVGTSAQLLDLINNKKT
jgi:hypothetical protein